MDHEVSEGDLLGRRLVRELVAGIASIAPRMLLCERGNNKRSAAVTGLGVTVGAALGAEVGFASCAEATEIRTIVQRRVSSESFMVRVSWRAPQV